MVGKLKVEAMTTAEMIAAILGPFYIIVAVGLFLNPDRCRRVIQGFFEQPALIYIGGIMALLMGLLILAFHRAWSGDWTVLVTVIGWLGVVKGAALIIRPESWAGLTEAIMRTESRIRIAAVFASLLGLFLTVKGYAVL